jgi:hypothetical protein
VCGANSMSRMSVSVTQRLARRVASRQRCFADCGWCWRSTCAGTRASRPQPATLGPGLQCHGRPAGNRHAVAAAADLAGWPASAGYHAARPFHSVRVSRFQGQKLEIGRWQLKRK